MTTDTALHPGPGRRDVQDAPAVAGYGAALTVTVTLALAAFLIVMAAAVLASHPQTGGLGSFTGLVNQQNQNAKTALFVIAIVVIVPGALIAGPRLADFLAGRGALAIVPALPAGLALALIAARLSHALPWGSGLKVLLVAVVAWAVAAAALVAWAARGHRLPERLSAATPLLAAVLAFGVVLSVTTRHSLHPVPLIVGAVVIAAMFAARRQRMRVPHGTVAIDVVVIVFLLLAIPDLVVFRTTGAVPNIYFEPGIVQYQHDYILGATNQLLGGGALLVGVPVSQYGVGLIYFLAGWFHLAPIGYGTFGFLDGVLTALLYAAAYGALRLAGVRRLIAIPAIAVAVVALIYGLQFSVGALPEEGPLRFGLPMLVVVGALAGVRWPRAGRAVALLALGVSAVWAFEAFAYTVVTFAAVALTLAWLRPAGARRRWLAREALLGLASCVAAHLILAVATLAGTGQLPHWSQYLAYVHAFLLGGQAGAITYGFASWSPVLAAAAAAFASAIALLLLIARAPETARSHPSIIVGLAATTAYEIAILSYADNRSSTYLLPYVALPLLMAVVLWLTLTTRAAGPRGLIVFALAVAAVMVSAAWPSIGPRFDRTLLAHARPGGGLTAALHRLWHPPAIDPRAPEGERLLDRYMPGKRALILLPTVPDLGTEILMRSHRSNSMFIGDPKADSLVPSVFVPKLRKAVAALRPGDRLLTDGAGLLVAAALRRNPAIDPLDHPIAGGWQEEEWLLREIDRRFALRPLYRDPDGLVVAELSVRGS